MRIFVYGHNIHPLPNWLGLFSPFTSWSHSNVLLGLHSSHLRTNPLDCTKAHTHFGQIQFVHLIHFISHQYNWLPSISFAKYEPKNGKMLPNLANSKAQFGHSIPPPILSMDIRPFPVATSFHFLLTFIVPMPPPLFPSE
jgi:hypothetical protein